MYITIRFITNLPTFFMKSFLRRREDIQNIGKIGNLNMNHMVIHIIRRGISRWFRIWSQKNIFDYAFKRKSRLKFSRSMVTLVWGPKCFALGQSYRLFWDRVTVFRRKLQLFWHKVTEGVVRFSVQLGLGWN